MLGVRHHGREPKAGPQSAGPISHDPRVSHGRFKGRKASVPWKDLLDLKGGL